MTTDKLKEVPGPKTIWNCFGTWYLTLYLLYQLETTQRSNNQSSKMEARIPTSGE